MIPERPDLRVIDRAIELIETSVARFTCYALRDAAMEFHNCTYAGLEYRDQYTRLMRSPVSGRMPYWWSESRSYKEERIAALQYFRNACINAAKKEAKQ